MAPWSCHSRKQLGRSSGWRVTAAIAGCLTLLLFLVPGLNAQGDPIWVGPGPPPSGQCSKGQKALDDHFCWVSTTQPGYQCLVTEGNQLVEALALYGYSGRDTVIQIAPQNDTVLDLFQATVPFVQACARQPDPRTGDTGAPYSSGVVTITANNTNRRPEDLIVVNTAMRGNITNQLTGSARLQLQNLGWANLCELMVDMNDALNLTYISSLDMGVFPRVHTHQNHIYDSITIYGTYVDMATQLYISLVQNTVFDKVKALVEPVVVNLPDWNAVYSEITTCLHRAVSFSMPAAKVINSTFVAVEDDDDPILIKLRKTNRLIRPPVFCNGSAIPTSHVIADVAPDVGPLYRASNTAEWHSALTNATNLTFSNARFHRPPVAAMLLGTAVMDPLLFPNTLEVGGPMLMWGPVLNDPNNILFGTLDMLHRAKVLHVNRGGQLFIQQLSFTNLLQQPLPALHNAPACGVNSALPLAAITATEGSETWATDPPIQMHTAELQLPTDDYLALMLLGYQAQGRGEQLAACLDPIVVQRAGCLGKGVYEIEMGSQSSNLMNAFVLTNFVGWGINATNTCIKAQGSFDGGVLATCLSNQASQAQSDGSSAVLSIVLGSCVAGGVLLVVLAVLVLMLWHRLSHRNRGPQFYDPDAALAAKKMGKTSLGSTNSSHHSSEEIAHCSRMGPGHHLAVTITLDEAKRMSVGSAGTSTGSSTPCTAHDSRSSSSRERYVDMPAYTTISSNISLYELVHQAEEQQVSRSTCRSLCNPPLEKWGTSATATPHGGSSCSDATAEGPASAPCALAMTNSHVSSTNDAGNELPKLGRNSAATTQPPSSVTQCESPASQLSSQPPSSQMMSTGGAASEAQRSNLLLCSAVEALKVDMGAQDYIQQIAKQAGHLGNGDQVVVRGVLGRGSWGTVYEGEWRGLPVAVKTMVFQLPDAALSSLGGNMAVPQHARAIMEAAIAASVGHRNLVCTYRYDIKPVNARHTAGDGVNGLHIEEAFSAEAQAQPGFTEYKLFLIQELCGTTLAHALLQRALFDAGTGHVHEALVLHLLLDVAQGLDYLHTKNIIHGDLKPANVLLKTETGHPIGVTAKLADFGLSSHMPEGATHVSNYTSGTPFYVAPEVVQYRRTSTASDIYSYGILMWQLYSGGVPYLQDAEGRYVANPCFGKFEPGQEPHPVYMQLLHRCLHNNPRFRPNAAQIAAVLCGLLGLGQQQQQAPAAV